MIEFKQFSFQYPQSEEQLFSELNLCIPGGTLSMVAGASGSGKSTLLRCINGLVPHFSGGRIGGSLSVLGRNPIEEGPEKMASIVGIVFQEPEAQFVYDTVEDEIAFVLENFGFPYDEMHDRVEEILKSFKLERLRKEKFHNLSGGEKQKVALASVMVNQPKILLLDEPTSQLGPASAEDLLDFVLKLKTEYGLTIVISEHRLERLLPYADNIIYIDDEHAVQFGSPQDILPEMSQVPPIISIGRKFHLSPLPLNVDQFPARLSKPPAAEIRVEKKYMEHKQTIIQLSDFSVSLSGRTILDGINLAIHAEEILTILGSNGAGKTTLLRGIMGLVESEGKKQFKQSDMRTMTLSELIATIAYLPQNPNDLLFSETVLDELKTTLENHNLQFTEGEITDHLRQFGLASMEDRFPRDLSVGERQRTALAAVTVHGPQIIMLDEPTRGMDYRAKEKLSDLLKSWRGRGNAILLVTHDIELAAKVADRAVILETGRIKFAGSPREAFTQFPNYQTQTARIFPGTGWITPDEVDSL